MNDSTAPSPAQAPRPRTAKTDASELRQLESPEWFQEKLRMWVNRMGLGAWTIRTSYKPKLRGAEGYAKVNPNFLEADLEFRQDILVTRGDVVIVHELTHILTDDWASAMQDVIRDYVPRKLQREARDQLRPHEESVVEAIAHALVRTAEEKEREQEAAQTG